MKKSFTVIDILFNQLSPKKGTIEYYLIDELGNDRKVTAIAFLGFGKKIKTVKALYQREKILVEALATVEIDQTFTVDFTEVNKTPRLLSTRKRNKAVDQFGHVQHLDLIPDASRFPLLSALVMLGTVIVFMLGVYTN